MDMTHGYWEENANLHRVKYEGCNTNNEEARIKDDRGVYPCCETNLNFSTATYSEDDSEYGPYKKNKVTRQDPMSHRIIEKRRRDRMNNCLADLSRLIPTEYLKKGRGRIEKTEIIEMAIKHMKYLQQEHGTPSEHFRLGYQECLSETMRFMVEVEGYMPREGICLRILNHLQKHCDSLSRVAPPTIQPINDTRLVQHLPVESRATNENNDVYRTPIKSDVETNNNNGTKRENHEKHAECTNGVSYKYKTNIKLRFSQDNAVQEDAKRQKLENGRRSSNTSIENQSSSRSSPPNLDVCGRIPDSDHRISPTDNPSPPTNLIKLEKMSRNDPSMKNNSSGNFDPRNFNVPIFVLHTKGSYYLPLTIDYRTLSPFLHNYDLLENVPNVVLHPVTINVNFQPNNNCKMEYNNGCVN